MKEWADSGRFYETLMACKKSAQVLIPPDLCWLSPILCFQGLPCVLSFDTLDFLVCTLYTVLMCDCLLSFCWLSYPWWNTMIYSQPTYNLWAQRWQALSSLQQVQSTWTKVVTSLVLIKELKTCSWRRCLQFPLRSSAVSKRYIFGLHCDPPKVPEDN